MSEFSTGGCKSYLKALADETRWQIVRELLRRSLTVGELSARLRVSQYNASKHVKILRDAGIVKALKQGRHLHCQIAAEFKQTNRRKKRLNLGCCSFKF